MIKDEWKSLLRNKLMLIVVIAIIVIPIIYAGLFLKSMWDPYGSVDNLPVAVVNEDKPVEYNGKTLSIGKDMADELKDNDSMAFNIVDSKTAEDGLANGTYYMVITIPEDFSANAATVMDDNPKQMTTSPPRLQKPIQKPFLILSQKQVTECRKLLTDPENLKTD